MSTIVEIIAIVVFMATVITYGYEYIRKEMNK